MLSKEWFVLKFKLKKKVVFMFLIVLMLLILLMSFFLKDAGGEDKNSFGNISNVDTSKEVVQEEEMILPSDVFVKVFTLKEGKSIFIDSGERELLYNTGSKENVGYILDNIEGLVDGSLDIVIASNGEKESYEGYEELSKKYMIDKTIYGQEVNTLEFKKFKGAALNQGNFTNDKDEDLILTDNVVFSVFDVVDNDQSLKNNSVLGLLQVGNTNVLFTGSCGKDIQQKLNNKIPKNISLLISDKYDNNYFLEDEEYEVLGIVTLESKNKDAGQIAYNAQNIYEGENLVFRLDGDDITLVNQEGEESGEDQ